MVYLDENIWGFDLEAALLNISEQRRDYALKIRHELGRRQSVLAYLLLKKGLLNEYGLDVNPAFSFGEHGKPVLTDFPSIHFSLSHCREAVICAVSDHPVGVDIESVGRYKESVVRYSMNDDEQLRILEAEQKDVAFARLWTMKEACVKMTGEGLQTGVKDILVDNGYSFTTVVDPLQRFVYSLCFQRR